MSEFVFLYRRPIAQSSPQQMQDRMTRWRAWFSDMEQKGHLKVYGHPLENTGSVVRDKNGKVSDGPYAETKDVIGGYSLIEAKDLAEAQQLATGCPIYEQGGMIEIRPIAKM